MNFEDFEIWKEGMRISLGIYNAMKSCKDFSLKDQMQRAAVSIPSNFAEGYERQSNKEFIHFLFIAKGSCGELRTQLYLAKELNYIETEDFKQLFEKCKLLSSKIQKFIKIRQSYEKNTKP
ncbi:MAG: four helix bundle protein [Prevotellaceae bacterium]|nr:four helix bundle protein [Prevotellaceae bacterium]